MGKPFQGRHTCCGAVEFLSVMRAIVLPAEPPFIELIAEGVKAAFSVLRLPKLPSPASGRGAGGEVS